MSGSGTSWYKGWQKQGKYLAFLFFLVLGALVAMQRQSLPPQAVAEISIEGEVLYEIVFAEVKEPYLISLETAERYHVISVSLDSIAVLEASCPDQVCVKQGYRNSSPILCLPHQLMISFSGGEGLEVDAVAG